MNILFMAIIAVALVVAFIRAAGRAHQFVGWVAWSSLLLVIAPLGSLVLTAWA